MKVILIKDVKGIGKKFEEKQVSDGHATNFLIPKKLAVSLSDSSATAIRILKEQGDRSLENEKSNFAQTVSKISGITFTIKMKANEKGHLFASLSATQISELLKKEGTEINPEYIVISEPIKTIGTFEVSIVTESPSTSLESKEAKFKLEVIRA